MHAIGLVDGLPPWFLGGLFFKDEPGPKGRIRAQGGCSEKIKERRPVLRCRACKKTISSMALAIKINRRHRHRFINPEGVFYQIGCFAEAAGCLVVGTPTVEHTWFPGFSWSLSLCGNCQDHLGWYFQSAGGQEFYGLIHSLLFED